MKTLPITLVNKLTEVVFFVLKPIFEILSGEFLLRMYPNGGSIVFLRSILVSTIIYVFAIGLFSFSREQAGFIFSKHQFWIEVHSTLPWMGAIFGGVYAAFYARFSSQWNYLANLYNQIMATGVSIEQRNDDTGKVVETKQYIAWQAAFIEDAIELHLARKAMFSPMIKELLEDPDIKTAFLAGATNGIDKLKTLDLE